MRVIRGVVGLGMGLTPLLPPNFLVSNGTTSYTHLLSPHRKAIRLSTPTNPSSKAPPSNWPGTKAPLHAPQNARRPGVAIRSHLGVTRAKWGLDLD